MTCIRSSSVVLEKQFWPITTTERRPSSFPTFLHAGVIDSQYEVPPPTTFLNFCCCSAGLPRVARLSKLLTARRRNAGSLVAVNPPSLVLLS
jgi:hypothetical protein